MPRSIEPDDIIDHGTFSPQQQPSQLPHEVTDREDDDNRTIETFCLRESSNDFFDLSRAFNNSPLIIMEDFPSSEGSTTLRLPTKLNAMLSNPAIEHIISWLPHGRSWKVHDPKRFMDEVMPHYFEYANYYSFIRLVNAWGFRRLSKGPSKDSYWHEMFVRGLPHLHSHMRRLTAKDKKEPMHPDDEPDLFEQSRLHPLPPCGVIPFPPRPPQRSWILEQERLQKQAQKEQSKEVPSPPILVRKSVCWNNPQLEAPKVSNAVPSSIGMMRPYEQPPQQQQSQRFSPPAVVISPAEEYNHEYNNNNDNNNHGFYDDDDFSLGAPVRYPPCPLTNEAQMLRMQQARVAATRRALERKLEELRQEEERLDMAVAAAAIASSQSNTSMSSNQQQQQQQPYSQQNHAVPAQQERPYGPPWLPPLRSQGFRDYLP